jgi:hypothetical protein
VRQRYHIRGRAVFPFLILFLSVSVNARLSRVAQEHFFRSILNHDSTLVSLLDSIDRGVVERFGIAYDGVHNKFLIGEEIDPAIIPAIKNGSLAYALSDSDLGNGYSRLRFTANDIGYHKDYYFHGEQLVLPARWITRNWKETITPHFVIRASDSAQVNEYIIWKLEEFVTRTMDMLGYTQEERELVERGKIYYLLCRDGEGIERLTGFRTRGMYLLACDAVASVYPCHFHELTHLLMNLKLRRLPLYTHPFLQEGFAVAAGGRGGIGINSLFPMAVYLERSGTMDYTQLCPRQEFKQNDASLTYPVSGLYNYFLLCEWGIQNYLSFYRSYSSSQIDSVIVDTTLLPSRTRWNSFLDSVEQSPAVVSSYGGLKIFAKLVSSDSFSVSTNSTYYYFRLKSSLGLYTAKTPSINIPGALDDAIPDQPYRGEKYLLMADSNEIRIYNRWTRTLIGSLVASFAMPPSPMRKHNGYYEFYVRKELFEEPISEMKMQ